MITDTSTELSSSLATRGIVLDYNKLSVKTLDTTIAWKSNCSSNYSVTVFTNELEGELTENMLTLNKSIGSDTNRITIPTNEATGRYYFSISTVGKVQDNCPNSSAYYFSFHQES